MTSIKKSFVIENEALAKYIVHKYIHTYLQIYFLIKGTM